MQLFQIWFSPDSGLLPYGVAILLLAMVLPCQKERTNRRLTAACLVVYLLSEMAMTFALLGWLWRYACLFVGGAALSFALGRLVKSIWKTWKTG